MNPMWWMAWSAICACGAGALVYFIMQSRMEVLLSKQREDLAEARAALGAQREALEGSLRNAEETTRRKALDEFLADIRVEERSYTREHKAFFLTRKCLVRQERIFFRNLPLSNWVESEIPIEEGADIEKLAQTMSIFMAEGIGGSLQAPPGPTPIRKLLR